MTLYFQNLGNGALTQEEIDENQTSYTADLPPGNYIAFAYTQENDLGGMYSEAVVCGLGEACADHTPRPFEVIGGQMTEGIDLCDWYAQDQVPPAPEKSVRLGPYQMIAGLVYSDMSADETWQGNSNGKDPLRVKVTIFPDCVRSEDCAKHVVVSRNGSCAGPLTYLGIKDGEWVYMAWGWLPCGPVYSVLVSGLAAGSATSGAALMLAFGLGTLPNLLGMGLFARQLQPFMQQLWVRRAAGLTVAGFGVWGLLALAYSIFTQA